MFKRLIRIARGADRRRERRVQVRLAAEVGGVPGRLTDISLGGLGFYADRPGLSAGRDVTARLMPEGRAPFDVPARVVGMDEEGMVFCVAFREVGPEAFDRIQGLITRQSLGHADRAADGPAG